VPPLYAISDYAELARAGRPFADSLMPADLPGGVDSVKVPRITTGTKMRVQAGDKAAVTTQDIVTAETTAELVTVAGYVDVAVQAIDQAPIDTQALLFADLEADYAQQFDTLLWSGAGPGSDEPLGVLTLGGTNSSTYTDTTPTVGELYPKIGSSSPTESTMATSGRHATHARITASRWAASSGSTYLNRSGSLRTSESTRRSSRR